MGEAKRKKLRRVGWPEGDSFRDTLDLHMLPPAEQINCARIRELTGDDTIAEDKKIILRTFRAAVGERTFYVGFCLGDEPATAPIGMAVVERLMMEVPGSALHVVPVAHEDIA